jgi:hypothetical protein
MRGRVCRNEFLSNAFETVGLSTSAGKAGLVTTTGP